MTLHAIPDDPKCAEHNRRILLDALAGGGTAVLPPGVTYIDEYLKLGPEHSHCTLLGQGAHSVLRQIGQPWPRMGGVVLWGEGFEDPGPTESGVAEGALVVPVADPPLFAAGQWVYVTDGQALAAEYRGEWRRVVRHDYSAVQLDRPLRRGYRAVRLMTGRPVVGVTLCDFTIAQPEHGGVYKLLAKFAVGLRCERLRLGLPGDPAAGWGTGECGHVSLIDCEAPGAPLGLNTTHDVTVRGGRYQSIVGEEACSDCDLEDVLVAPAGAPQPGLKWYFGCDRLRVRNVRIEGGGAAADAGGTHSPLGVWGRECRLEGVTVAYSHVVPGYSGIGLGGDGLVACGLASDLECWVTDGTGILLCDSSAPSWALVAGTGGRLRDLKGPAAWGGDSWDADPGALARKARAIRGTPGPELPGHVREWAARPHDPRALDRPRH